GVRAEDAKRSALDQARAVVEARDLVCDVIRRADLDANGASALPQQLATEQRRSNPWMHAPGGVEQPTVAAFDERRNDPGAGRVRQALEGGLPRAVDERSVEPGVSHFAGWKNGEGAAASQPHMSRPQTGKAPGCRVGSTERIDEEARIM